MCVWPPETSTLRIIYVRTCGRCVCVSVWVCMFSRSDRTINQESSHFSYSHFLIFTQYTLGCCGGYGFKHDCVFVCRFDFCLW